MLTWRFWRALANPPVHHPIYRHTYHSGVLHRPQGRMNVLFIFMLLFAGTGLCWTTVFNWIPMLVVGALMLANTAYSLRWAVIISKSIAVEYEHNRHDLLSVSPSGAMGVNWAMGMAQLHRARAFEWVRFVARLLTIIALVTLLVGLCVTTGMALQPGASRIDLDLLTTVVYGIGLVIAFYADHIQSSVLGSLTGIYAAINLRNHAEARVRALGRFLLVQSGVYFISVLAVVLIIPATYRILGLSGWFADILLVFMGIAQFYGLHEYAIQVMWKRLVHELNTDLPELDALTSPAA